ncbi:MAG TPA: molecular chaperone HtpG [Planctomycetota bacterium]|nr:molecular chaperone HtpG [Planctomycetota bacterium]
MAETMQFKTELKQLLNIIIHSLYTHKDIFLRELISNASDAIDKVRFESLTKHELLEENSDWKIKLIPNKDKKTLTISDNGIGMSREAIVENLGTIAKSGTRAFLESLKAANAKDRPELIGQFGVGFYSAFMVADKVTVISRQAGDKKAGVWWESTGEGDFSVENVEKETRGTDVILHLKEGSEEFLETWRLREIVKKYSDFVEHPIAIDVERTDKDEKKIEEEILNARKALWLRSKSEITTEEYNEFYKHLSRDFEEPAKVIHYSAEGNIEFKALLYIPAHKPYDFMWNDPHKALHLYIRRVFIMDDCEALLPEYLCFVRGVVDAPDLPLNVSRENLQRNPLLEKIRNNLVNKILATLAEMKEKENDKYLEFYGNFSGFLKEGINRDYPNREKLADLLLFESTKTESGKMTSLSNYVGAMPAGQNEIYYLTGETREQLENSPYLEVLKEKGYDVLLMTEPIDEILVQSLSDYKGKKLKAADKGVQDADKVDEQKVSAFKDLLAKMKSTLSDVKDIRLSGRLKNSASCLVTEEGEMSANLERLLKRAGRETAETRRILELNAEHPAVAAMQKIYQQNAADERVDKYARLLYDQALIAEGSKIKDPAGFAQRVNELLIKDAEK